MTQTDFVKSKGNHSIRGETFFMLKYHKPRHVDMYVSSVLFNKSRHVGMNENQNKFGKDMDTMKICPKPGWEPGKAGMFVCRTFYSVRLQHKLISPVNCCHGN